MVLSLAALTGVVATIFVWRSAESPRKRLIAAGSLALGVGLLAVNLASGVVDFNPLQLTGAPRDKTMIAILQDPSQLGRIVYTGWSPFSRVDVVETGDHSARYIFADGGAGSYMMAYNGDPATLGALPMTRSIEALPFASGSVGKTLIIGAGGGKDILLALNADAQAITAVEVNPAIVQATRDFAAYNGNVLDLPGVTLIEGDARSFTERSADQYDLIYMNLVYTQAVEPASQTLIENYIFTTEAFKAFLEHLAPGGRLAMVAHNGLEGSRAMLTALRAMQDMNIAPAQALDHIWLWRASSSDQTSAQTVLIVGKDALPLETIQTLNTAARVQGMQPLFSPGDYEVLFEPLRQGTSLAGYIQSDAAYNLSPTGDDQPYFFNLDYALPPAVQSAFIVSALFALGLLVVAWFTEDETQQENKRRRRVLIGYTALIGLGFMLIEVPLIQRFQLLLGQPILSLAAVLATLLLSGGAGSLFSQRWQESSLPARIRVVGVAITLLAVAYWVALPPLVESLLGATFAVRLLAIIVLTAPLGFPMGMPFPSVIRLAGVERQQVALIWAINGAFSVLGSVLSMVISIQWGFKWALLLGAGMYLLLAVVVSALTRSGVASRLPLRVK
jgi:spermidine synthase